MKVADKNKVFFALIHYVLVEQKNVDWILKTSLIDFTGISSLLEQKPYKKDSILDDVVSYIYEVKPYHVQFSNYFEHYQTHREDVNVSIKDKLEQEITMRFDALQSIPDLNRVFYGVHTTLPTEKEYNVNNLVVYLQPENKFFIRVQEGENDFHWEMLDEPIYDDGFYYNAIYDGGYYYNSDDSTRIKLWKGVNGVLTKFTEEEQDALMDTHEANRLFCMGLHDVSEIKKEVNGNFKGIEVNGSEFDIGKFGYDIFNYDTTDYDSPTVIYDYYFLNNLIEDLVIMDGDTEVKRILGAKSELAQHYTLKDNAIIKKTFFNAGKERFVIPEEIIPDTNETLRVYKNQSGVITEYTNYEIDYTSLYVDMFAKSKDKAKVYVVVTDSEDNVTKALIAECSAYTESTSETLRRTIVYINDDIEEYSLIVPSYISGSGIKIAIQKAFANGTEVPVLNPEIIDNNYVASMLNYNEYEHVSMVSFDFKYLYDKIYTWEDKYGRSNNVVRLDGKGFYRPLYEEDRPRERVVLDPMTAMFIYKEDNNTDILWNDFKNEQKKTSKVLFSEAKIVKCIPNIIDGTISNIQLSTLEGFDNAPGKALINSEIIEYNKVDKMTNTISELKRATDGSFFFINGISTWTDNHTTHAVDDKVYPFKEDEWIDVKRNNVYSTYNVRSPGDKIYDCPSGIKKNFTIKVKKLPVIHLTEDFYASSNYIKIDSPNIMDADSIKKVQRGEVVTGNFFLRINNDNIPFRAIYKNSSTNSYYISDFTIPDEYKKYGDKPIFTAEDSFILSTISEYINNFDVEIIEGDEAYDIVVEDGITYAMQNDRKIFKITGTKFNTDGSIKKLGNTIYAYYSAMNDVTHEPYLDEIYFGYIDGDNTIYKKDGIIYGKITGENDSMKMIDVMTQVTIKEPLEKHDSVMINIHNFKYGNTTGAFW